MTEVKCLKCNGHGLMVRSDYSPDHPYTLRAIKDGEDVTTRRWYRCPNCYGAGTLPAWSRAEVWDRVATAGIVLGPEFRSEGDLGYDEIPT